MRKLHGKALDHSNNGSCKFCHELFKVVVLPDSFVHPCSTEVFHCLIFSFKTLEISSSCIPNVHDNSIKTDCLFQHMTNILDANPQIVVVPECAAKGSRL